MKENRNPESIVREIRRKTRRKFSVEESISELCRKEGIHPNLYYKWSKEFLESGKNRLKGDIKRQATSKEVSKLKEENAQLKELVAELSLRNRILKKIRLVRSSNRKNDEIQRIREDGNHKNCGELRSFGKKNAG